MSGMVERVAKAIHNAEYEGALAAPGTAEHAFFCEVARAAIAAMREPTEAMVLRVRADRSLPPYRQDVFADAWRTMIDGALNEKPEGK